MEFLAPITQLGSAFREFVAPRYRPELYYMRGPGPAYARRVSRLEARFKNPSLGRNIGGTAP